MAALAFSKVAKTYGHGDEAVKAVQDMDLEIADGEFLALLGPSGCGKSSTLRMTVGLEEISGGEIRFDGKRVNELTPQQRNVAMGFENYSLYPNLTVEKNLRFPLEVAGTDRKAIDARVREIGELLEIGPIMDRLPAELSGGQQQRVSLGRALVRQPAAFILDEVMSHVDSQLKFRMLNDLADVHREFGRTTMYVTHDQLEALALADRIAVMHQSRLQQVGTRQDLFLKPSNTFVAGFIGEPAMNLIEAQVADGKIVLGDNDLQLPYADGGKLNGRKVTFGCRPQHLAVDPGSDDLRARIEVREYLGERVIYSLSAGSCRFKAVADAGSALKVGDVTGFRLPKERISFFDADTGDRIKSQGDSVGGTEEDRDGEV